MIKRGDRSSFVRIAQEWLCLHGIFVDIDSAFGPATEAAVKKFQFKNGLNIDGVIGEKTLKCLTAPLDRAKRRPTPRLMVYETVVTTAIQHLVEHPREVGGDNCGPWVRHYCEGNSGSAWAWCAGFVCSILEQAYAAHNSSPPFKRTYSCDELAKMNESVLKRPRSGMEAREMHLNPGSVFLCRRTETDWVHTGIVKQFCDDYFSTIEGNTNERGQREGIEVRERIRGYARKDFIPI